MTRGRGDSGAEVSVKESRQFTDTVFEDSLPTESETVHRHF